MHSRNVAVPVSTALVVVAIGLSGGCASTPPTTLAQTLEQSHNQAIRRLTVQCYWEMEGERLVFGAYPVHSACRRWAEARIQVRVPANERIALD
jgi:hypothetical protein